MLTPDTVGLLKGSGRGKKAGAAKVAPVPRGPVQKVVSRLRPGRRPPAGR
jgi:hypothetical protein